MQSQHAKAWYLRAQKDRLDNGSTELLGQVRMKYYVRTGVQRGVSVLCG